MPGAEAARLQAILDDQFRRHPRPHILEAGCGSSSHVTIPADARVSGIDISEKQLARNTRLDERILGDLEEYDFAPASFDVIICWDVLEHLPRPERVLERFARAIRPDGLIVLALPHALSVKGLVTKLTPHGVHVAFYRHVLGRPDAGKNDTGPFPTFMRFSIAPHRIARFARAHGLASELELLYEGALQLRVRAKYGLADAAFGLLGRATRAVTGGRYDANATEAIIVLRKPC